MSPDTTQILLLILIILVGGTIVLVGIQFYFILKELKQSLEQINGILEDFQQTSSNIATGSQYMKDAAAEVRTLAQNVQEGLSAPLVSGVATFGLVKKLVQPLFEKESD